MDFYGFYTGQEFEAYKYLGAHYTKERTTFRTFAPSAAGVELVLNGQGHGMQRVHDGNFYEITLDQVKEGDLYEFVSGTGMVPARSTVIPTGLEWSFARHINQWYGILTAMHLPMKNG